MIHHPIISPIGSGVPQGSVLCPLLFLIYINQLEGNKKSKIKFFADDTLTFSFMLDPAISASELNHDLEQIKKWAHQSKMAFNPEPNKLAIEVLFSPKKALITLPFTLMGILSPTNTIKYTNTYV